MGTFLRLGFMTDPDEFHVLGAALRPDGARLATLQTDGQIIIWDAETGEHITVIGSFEASISRCWG